MRYRNYHGRIKRIDPDVVVDVVARSAGHARSLIAAKARDAGYDASVPDVQVRVGQSFGFPWVDRPNTSRPPALERVVH